MKYELVAFGAPYGIDGEIIDDCNTIREAKKAAVANLCASQYAKLYPTGDRENPVAMWICNAQNDIIRVNVPE